MSKKNSPLLEQLDIEIDQADSHLSRLKKMRELYLKSEEEEPAPAKRGGRKPKAESNGESAFPGREEESADAADGQ